LSRGATCPPSLKACGSMSVTRPASPTKSSTPRSLNDLSIDQAYNPRWPQVTKRPHKCFFFYSPWDAEPSKK
jgi:hypothetical protein